jgi:hypothetical protein
MILETAIECKNLRNRALSTKPPLALPSLSVPIFTRHLECLRFVNDPHYCEERSDVAIQTALCALIC